MKNIFIILHFESVYWEKLLCDLEITPYRSEWAIDKSPWFKDEIVWFPRMYCCPYHSKVRGWGQQLPFFTLNACFNFLSFPGLGI